MIDVTKKLRIILQNDWTETNPPLFNKDTAPYGISFEYDEPHPLKMNIQLLLENYPVKREWLHDMVYRADHRVRLTLYVKPVNYTTDNIEAKKTIFLNAKTEIDRILCKYKFGVSDITNLDLSPNGWNDTESIRVGRGTKGMGTSLESKGGMDTAIVFRAETIVTAVYYQTLGTPVDIYGGGGGLTEASYIVIKKGSLYNGINGSSMIIEFSNADGIAVVNQCIEAMQPNGGIVFIKDPITSPLSLLFNNNVLIMSNTHVGGGGAMLPTIMYTGSDYAIKQIDEDTWKSVSIINLAIKNTNVSAKGGVRLGKVDYADLDSIGFTGYASEAPFNIPYSSLKGNLKTLTNIRIEGELQSVIGIDIQADWVKVDGAVISKTTGAAIRVGDRTQSDVPYNTHLVGVHGYNCQHRFLDIEWAYYLEGEHLFDEHDVNFVGTKESSYYHRASSSGKNQKDNILTNCIAAYDVGAGHPPSPYMEVKDEDNSLLFIRSDTDGFTGVTTRGLKIMPRLIIDDNGVGTANTLTITSTGQSDILRLRKYALNDIKDIVVALNNDFFQIWNITDSLSLLKITWNGKFQQHFIPQNDNTYSIGSDDYRWAYVRAESVRCDHLDVLSGTNQGVKCSLTPDANNTYDLGSETKTWASIHIQKLCLYSQLALDCDLIPVHDVSKSLGDDTYRWLNVRAYAAKFETLEVTSANTFLYNLKVNGTDVITHERLLKNIDIGAEHNFIHGLKVNGTEVISEARTLHNVDIDAGQCNSGTLPDARLDGATTSVTVRNAAGDGTITLYFVNGLFKYSVG